MLLHRYQLLQVIAYATASEEQRPPDDDAAAFAAVLYNEATANARVRFMELLGDRQGPWAPFEVANFDPPYSYRRGAPPIERGPAALVLLLGKDEGDPNLWIDRGDFVPEAGTAAADPWRALYDALARWDTEAIESFATTSGWQIEELERPEERTDPEQTPVAMTESTVSARPGATWWTQYGTWVAGGVGTVAALGLGVGGYYYLTRRPG